jgi:hypothetical protein
MTDYYTKADWSLIPGHMHQPVKDYVMKGWRPGGFLAAALENDFKGAAGRADQSNQRALLEWAMFISNYMPAACQGSPEKVESWIKLGGIEGMQRLAADGDE